MVGAEHVGIGGAPPGERRARYTGYGGRRIQGNWRGGGGGGAGIPLK